MKKLMIVTTTVFFMACILVSYSFIEKKPGCGDSDDLFKQTLSKLTPYTYLKDYRIYMKEKKKSAPPEIVYYPITLNRGVKYKFLGAQSSKMEGQLTISLYTVRNDKPDFLFATNYKKEINKVYETIEFQVESTLNCVIAFSFKDGKEGCAVGVSSFLRD